MSEAKTFDNGFCKAKSAERESTEPSVSRRSYATHERTERGTAKRWKELHFAPSLEHSFSRLRRQLPLGGSQYSFTRQSRISSRSDFIHHRWISSAKRISFSVGVAARQGISRADGAYPLPKANITANAAISRAEGKYHGKRRLPYHAPKAHPFPLHNLHFLPKIR